MNDWNDRFMEFAKVYSTFSKDPSKKIGAVIIDPIKRIILSGGYNGFPRGVLDSEARLNDRELKYKYVVHAEMNAIYNATLNGVSLNGATLYVYGLPVCSECAKGIVQVGIKRVCISAAMPLPERWMSSWDMTKKIFNEVGIDYEWQKD
jgi:dCMP deaminase